MTRRSALEHQRHSLVEIREIMNSMKTLAFMETRKLEQFIEAQHQVVKSIGAVATEFMHFYQSIVPKGMNTFSVFLLVGTERGFCGDFNHVLFNHYQGSHTTNDDNTTLIVIGRKLYSLLLENRGEPNYIEGPNVVEEVPEVLHQIVESLAAIQAQKGPITLTVLSHTQDNDLVHEVILPPFQSQTSQFEGQKTPPLLNLAPEDFLLSLTEHYLFSTLHEKLYSSLLAENHRRVAHLDGAIRHLDVKSEELVRRLNTLRQEEIIEEIEVILLSASSLQQPDRNAGS